MDSGLNVFYLFRIWEVNWLFLLLFFAAKGVRVLLYGGGGGGGKIMQGYLDMSRAID